jgi:hypothetical protein
MSFLLKRSAVQGKVPTTAQLATGEIAVNTFDGRVYIGRNSGAASVVQVNPVAHYLASAWQNVSGFAPVETFEFDERALLFTQGQLQKIVMFVRVPAAYLTGSQINLKIGIYSPGTANNVKVQALTYLIRKNTDAVTSTATSNTSTNGDQALATSNQYFETTLDLTSTTGTINAVAVNPGDILKVILSRVATTGTEDANDLRVLPGTSEIIFS